MPCLRDGLDRVPLIAEWVLRVESRERLGPLPGPSLLEALTTHHALQG
jgi:hypothetical protein